MRARKQGESRGMDAGVAAAAAKPNGSRLSVSRLAAVHLIPRCGPLVSVSASEFAQDQDGQLCRRSDFCGVVFDIISSATLRGSQWPTPGANWSDGKAWSPPGCSSRFPNRDQVFYAASVILFYFGI